jgi:hypothetical protein
MIRLEETRPSFCFIIRDLDGDGSVLVQTDYDYPGTASTFGWSTTFVQPVDVGLPDIECNHDGTDGTVDCACGVTAGDFIRSAGEYLRDNIGSVAPDPGYFS